MVTQWEWAQEREPAERQEMETQEAQVHQSLVTQWEWAQEREPAEHQEMETQSVQQETRQVRERDSPGHQGQR